MEDAALEVLAYVLRLGYLISVIAVCVGLVTIAVVIFPPKNVRVTGRVLFGGQFPGDRTPIVERIAVGLCTPISLLGLVAAVQTVRLRTPSDGPYRPLSVLVVLATIMMGLPAIFWKTRLRFAAEGLATIALAVASVLTAASIGFLFVPLTVLMIWTCVQHLRDVDNSSSMLRASSG